MIPNSFSATWAAVASALANHLWQSTVFAAAAVLVTLLMRRNHARVRYALWLAASVKFLVPFSLLVALGSHLAWSRGATAQATGPYGVIGDFGLAFAQPVAPGITRVAAPASSSLMHLLPVLVASVWLVGFAAVLTVWFARWRRIAATMRAATPLSEGRELRALRRCEKLAGIRAPIPALASRGSLEPGIFGIGRPVLIWPEGISERLEDAHLEAILAHEVWHVRRRDNLASALHMVVEAIFWFYPLVWWLGARLVDERERACDEEVLRHGNPPQAYAESILKVCEFCLESPLACVSGVTGADLKKRIARITRNQTGEALDRWRKAFLAAVAAAALAAPLIVGMVAAPQLHAQAAAAQSLEAMEAAGVELSFDVASVKRDTTNARPTSNMGQVLDDAFVPTGGLFRVTGSPLRNYIWFAYKTQMIPVGLPSWGGMERFDIEARAAGNPSKDQYRLMMQSLLADRFKLAIHHEMREMPVYEFVLAKEGKLGPNLKADGGACTTTPADIQTLNNTRDIQPPSPSGSAQAPTVPCGVLLPVPPSAAGRMHIGGNNVTMALLAKSVTNPASGLDRQAIDRTGLTGTFDLNFEWAPAISGPGFTPDPSGPTFSEALQDQLGLKLQPATAPVDVLVIDHVEEPQPN